MNRAAIYARVSTERQERAGTIDSQVEQLRTLAEADGHVLTAADMYLDDGFSGSTLQRPALERLRDRAFDGLIDVVYVHSPDRLARRYAYQVLLMDELRRRSVEVRFVQGSHGASAEDQLLLQVQGVIAEYERAKIMERSRRGKLYKARAGDVAVLSVAPFGYRLVSAQDGCPAAFQINLEAARTVRRVFDEFTSHLKSIRSIGLGLKADGIPMARGGLRWGTSSVFRILTNPAYKGQAAFGKTEVGKRLAPRGAKGRPDVPRKLNSSARARPRDQWITLAVPPLVSAQTFDKAAELLQRNLQLPVVTKRMTRCLLTGLAVCVQCGYAVNGVGGSSTTRYRYYRCGGTHASRFEGKPVCDMPTLRGDLLDDEVWQAVTATLQDPERMLAEWTRRGSDDGAAVHAQETLIDAQRVLTAQRQGLARLQDAYEAQVITLDELRERSDRIRARLGQAEHDLDAAQAELHSHHELKLLSSHVQQFAAQLGDGLETLAFQDKLKIVRLLIARVEVGRDGTTVVFRLPKPNSSPPPGSDDRDREAKRPQDFAKCSMGQYSMVSEVWTLR